MPQYLIEGAIYLTAAVIAVPLFKRLGLGSVLGYLIAGIVIGPSALHLIADPERVIHFAEFGVVMLLFLIGLELEPEHAWRMRKAIFGLGGVQVTATIAIVFAAAAWSGLNARGFKTTVVDHDPEQVELLRGFGWQVYYGDASRLDLLEQAGIASAKLFVIAIDDPQTALVLARMVRERWPGLPIIARARGRTDAYELRDLEIDAVRETFYSGLEAATQALQALGETEQSAKYLATQFERHDKKIFEQMRSVRDDRAAMIGLAEQGRKDLAALLSNELAGEREDENSQLITDKITVDS